METLMRILAERSGQQLVYSNLAAELRVAADTVMRWVDLLGRLHYGFVVRPWFANVAKALRKEPKWFLRDWSGIKDDGTRTETLLACHLLNRGGLDRSGIWRVRAALPSRQAEAGRGLPRGEGPSSLVPGRGEDQRPATVVVSSLLPGPNPRSSRDAGGADATLRARGLLCNRSSRGGAGAHVVEPTGVAHGERAFFTHTCLPLDSTRWYTLRNALPTTRFGIATDARGRCAPMPVGDIEAASSRGANATRTG